MARAGFNHEAVVEWDHNACETLRRSHKHRSRGEASWPIHETDVRHFDYAGLPRIDLVSGGPPCQPFSIGGKHRGPLDDRNLFPEAVRAVRELQPKAFVFENVKGLLRTSFEEYFRYVTLQLTHPELIPKRGESWERHAARLERHNSPNRLGESLAYNVHVQLVNAADYGVPQKRERLFLIGFRTDLRVDWRFPEPTHSRDVLLRDQWISASYWDSHQVSKSRRPTPDPAVAARVRRLSANAVMSPTALPWRTVRDAIADLPEPTQHVGERGPNHVFMQGAKTYPGHTGSPLDEPAKTLKAGDHGVPGGENMLVREDGSVRYFTVLEAARLQTFPDDYLWHGSWSEVMRQLGNAVPVSLGETIGKSIAGALALESGTARRKTIPRHIELLDAATTQ